MIVLIRFGSFVQTLAQIPWCFMLSGGHSAGQPPTRGGLYAGGSRYSKRGNMSDAAHARMAITQQKERVRHCNLRHLVHIKGPSTSSLEAPCRPRNPDTLQPSEMTVGWRLDGRFPQRGRVAILIDGI